MDAAQVTLHHGDCLYVLRALPAASVDAVVTDPPYELAFMGRQWDSTGIAYNVDLWRECLRVLRPGGHIAAFGGTRTYHRMACAVEDAGFEIRDTIMWLYGSGMPKGLNVGKAISAHQQLGGSSRTQNRRAALGDAYERSETFGSGPQTATTTATTSGPSPMGNLTPDGKRWEGWNTSLRPAQEPIIVARKPFVGSVAANVLQHGTGAINIEATKIEGGRWPANAVIDEHIAEDLGERALYFYCAKAPTSERPKVNGVAHSTVKPLALMRWLVRLVTPPVGTIVDPFSGSGTTLEASLLEGFHVIGIEREADYLPLIEHRVARAHATLAAAAAVPAPEPNLFDVPA